MPFDFVLPSEGQRTVVTRIRPLPVVNRVDVTADLECNTMKSDSLKVELTDIKINSCGLDV